MAGTFTWTGPSGGGYWSNPNSWDPVGPPTAGANVVFPTSTPAGDSFNFGVDESANINRLTVDSWVAVAVEYSSAVLTIDRAQTPETSVVNSGIIFVNGSSQLDISGKVTNTNGYIDADRDDLSSPNLNFAAATVNGGQILVESDGVVGINAGKTTNATTFNGVDLINDGVIDVGKGARLVIDGGAAASNTGEVSFTGTRGILAIDGSSNTTATVAGLANGGTGTNSINLRDISFNRLTASIVSSTSTETELQLSSGGGSETATITLLGQYATNIITSAPAPGYTGFALSKDAVGGTRIEYLAPPATA